MKIKVPILRLFTPFLYDSTKGNESLEVLTFEEVFSEGLIIICLIYKGFRCKTRLFSLSASGELGGPNEENHENDCWWWSVHHRLSHHVWRLSVQRTHGYVNTRIPLHQRV